MGNSNTPTPPPTGVKVTFPFPEQLRPFSDAVEVGMKEFGLRLQAVLEARDDTARRAEAREARIALGRARLDLEDFLRRLSDVLPPELRHHVPGVEKQRLILDQAAEFLDLAEAGRMLNITPKGDA